MNLSELGPYRLEEELGRGGMATVYRAVHVPLRRYVALKVLDRALSDNTEFLQRFQQEAEVAAQLDHPNIVPVYDLGTADGYQYIAMRLVDGPTLDQVIKESGPMPAARVLSIGAEIADALAYAHGQRVLHRDVKPSNIMLRTDDRPVLTDFGIARATERLGLTRANSLIGTPRYMSPEQAMAQPIDHRSDIYSLGMVLYEMLAGRSPFDATNTPSILYMHVHEPPRPLNQDRPDLSPAVRELVERCLAKSPDARFQSAAELASTCRAVLAVPGLDSSSRTVMWSPQFPPAHTPPPSQTQRPGTPPPSYPSWEPERQGTYGGPPTPSASPPPATPHPQTPYPAAYRPVTPAPAPSVGGPMSAPTAGGSTVDRLRSTIPLPLVAVVVGLVVVVGLWAVVGDRLLGRSAEPGSAAAPTATIRPSTPAAPVVAATPAQVASAPTSAAPAPASAPSPAVAAKGGESSGQRLASAMSALGSRDWAAALEHTDAGLKADPENPALAKAAVQAHLGRAQQLWTEGSARESLIHYSEVRESPLRAAASPAELREADLSAPYLWGELMSGVDMGLALFEYQKTFRRDPNFRDVRKKLYDGNISLARQALERNDREAAARYVSTARQVDPDRPEANDLSRQLTPTP